MFDFFEILKKKVNYILITFWRYPHSNTFNTTKRQLLGEEINIFKNGTTLIFKYEA